MPACVWPRIIQETRSMGMKTATALLCLCLVSYSASTTVSYSASTTISCQNGGTANGISCICLPEYFGKLCEIRCQNGASHDGIKCICTSAFYGKECEHPLEVEVSCQNGGTANGKLCTCLPEYFGKLCEIQCQNGARHDGIKCICTSAFYGKECENPLEAEAKVNTTVEVTVKIQKAFVPALNQTNSEEYKNFSLDFKAEMRKAYDNIPGFKDVEILSIRAGSIIVDHKVIVVVEPKANITIEEEYKNAVEVLKEQLKQLSNNNIDCNTSLCFNYKELNIIEVKPPTDREWCQQNTPPEYSHFFMPYYKDSKLTCVTRCTKGVKEEINCHYGTCQLSDTGHQCSCADPHIYWYSGDRCNTRVNKIAVYGGFAAALGVLLIVITTVTVLWQRANKKKQQSEESNDQEERWYEDVWDSSITKGFTFRNSGAVNWGDNDGNSTSSSKETFQPDLEKVDTTIQIKIQRPEIANSLSSA